jgi:hypothetical protein
MAKKEDHL